MARVWLANGHWYEDTVAVVYTSPTNPNEQLLKTRKKSWLLRKTHTVNGTDRVFHRVLDEMEAAMWLGKNKQTDSDVDQAVAALEV